MVQSFKKGSEVAKVTLLNTRLKPVTEKWFSRRRTDKRPIEVRYAIISNYKLLFKFRSPRTPLKPVTVEFGDKTEIGVVKKYFAEYLQEKFQKSQLIIILYKGKKLETQQRLRSWIRVIS